MNYFYHKFLTKKFFCYNILLHFIFIVLIFISCSNHNNLSKKHNELTYTEDLNIIFQKEWGGSEYQSTNKPHIIDRITLHHGGVEFKAEKDPAEYLRNLQSWSRSDKKWMDIPYHFLIDLNGKIYAGRSLKYPGDTNTTYDPTGHLLICLMGNYEIQKVNFDQIKSIIDLSTFFCLEFDIKVDNIKGHKDYADTDCPGEDFYRYLKNGSLVNAITENIKNNAYLMED
jgi:N-acetylmuramoyl-L-alanine amidase-like protein